MLHQDLLLSQPHVPLLLLSLQVLHIDVLQAVSFIYLLFNFLCHLCMLMLGVG